MEAVKRGERHPLLKEGKSTPDTNVYLKRYPHLYVKNELLYLKKTKEDKETE